jgi:class 3 adenylate cyclase
LARGCTILSQREDVNHAEARHGDIGRVVNLAARIQEMTRRVDADILVTQAQRETLDDRFALRELPAVEVRGIAGPVPIYAVDSFSEG